MPNDALIGRNLKGVTAREDFSVENWPSPDVGALSEIDLAQFLQRQEAVRLYLKGVASAAIYSSTGVHPRFINRAIRERCMHPHPDGRIYGWRALVPGIHIVKYRRKTKIRTDASGRGASGALSNLLLQEPDFANRLDKQILKSCADLKLAEIRRPRHALWAWFLKELRSLGYETRNEWPFTMKTMGYPSLCRYADAVLNANPLKAARIVGGPQLEKKMVSGDGINRPVHNPFERIEMDAHKLDGRFVVMIPAWFISSEH